MTENPGWHFGRQPLASVALSALQSGMAQTVTLLAARQMGKSEFLQYDLLPHAELNGWRVRYFGCATVSPRVLTRRLEEALSDFAAGEKWLMRQFARLTGSAPAASAARSERLVRELSQLRGEKKPSLLILDDVDRVLQLAGGDALLREILRAFSGTQGRARLVLSSTLAGQGQGLPPLLQQQTTVFTLPDIGDGFVHHLVAQYQQLTRSKRQDDSVFGKLASPYQGITWGQVDEGIMLDAFNRVQRIPYYFRALVEDLVLNPERAPAEALQLQLARLQRHRVAVLSWEEMSRLDRLLLTEVAKGTRQFYGEVLREYLAAQTGAARVTTSQVQSSLKKLMRNRVLGQESDGRYLIIDPHLAAALSVADPS
ncbi:ATP-binding protein [Silvimonas amylolytica]|uniref:AAA domain-containing protein n=1 Tax=Silvimonas amylolytica TaxID=449663 RepID=A0ABQ2PRL5_9NEIS|nr:ATP-binding protein [Silvimonas amylolytica]GGP28249.1 hypothetical protein GCM10010971_40680 [Silvimonas amylolytica]